MVETAKPPEISKRPSFSSERVVSQGLLFLLIVGLCAANGLLIKQNRDLKAIIAGFVNEPEFLKAGDCVPPFAANTISGQTTRIDYAGSVKTVLLVFSPQCSACEQTLPYWREIKMSCDRDKYQIFGVSLDDGAKTKSFLALNGLAVETFIGIDAELKGKYKLSLTPLTLVIDNSGRVERIWPGVFSKETILEVERYFGVSVARM